MKNIFTAATLSFLLLASAAFADSLPSGLPKTERRGDDMIMTMGKSQKVVKDFLYDIGEGQVARFYMRLPNRGRCALDVNWQGKIIAARCDK
jgi:hypothetical protein